VPLRVTQRIIFAIAPVLRPAIKMKSRPRKRSIKIGNRSTSVTVEDVFWDALRETADAQGISIVELISRIDNERQYENLSSAIRVFVANYANTSWKQTATVPFDVCVDRLTKLARSKATAPEVVALMMHELDAYLTSFPEPNVRFYERSKVRIAFANKARSSEVVIQFLRRLDE
jgi:predicted DNA-binding ribbon-helix-helix protein